MRRRTAFGLFLTPFVLLLSGCFPFGTKERKIAGKFRLEQWEDGKTYYLIKKGAKESGGGAIDGTVQRIGWNQQYIVAKRSSIMEGDPNGWMVIDIKTETITGPLTDAEFNKRSELKSIESFEPAVAWKKL